MDSFRTEELHGNQDMPCELLNIYASRIHNVCGVTYRGPVEKAIRKIGLYAVADEEWSLLKVKKLLEGYVGRSSLQFTTRMCRRQSWWRSSGESD